MVQKSAVASPTPLRDSHLVRFDNPRARGWQVRLPLWHPLSTQREYSEFFSDRKHGGSTKAKAAARSRRDDLFAQVSLPLRLRAATTNSGNTTGLVGVGLAFDSRYKGLAAYSWVAIWNEAGRQRRRRFQLSVHGFERALQQAVELREKQSGLEFSEEHLLQALALWSEVDCYVRTGTRPQRQAQRPARLRPSR